MVHRVQKKVLKKIRFKGNEKIFSTLCTVGGPALENHIRTRKKLCSSAIKPAASVMRKWIERPGYESPFSWSYGFRATDFSALGNEENIKRLLSRDQWFCLLVYCMTERLNFCQPFNIQPLRLLTNLKNESFLNKTRYSSFWSAEATDFKNLI